MQSDATEITNTTIWAVLACIALLGCSSTEPNPSLAVQGVPTADSGAQVDGVYGPDAGGILPPDAGSPTDAGAVGDLGSTEDAASAMDTGTTTNDAGGEAGGTDDGGGPSDTSVPDAATPDAGDAAPGPCGQNTDCVDPAMPFCVEGSCVQCMNNADCSGGDQCLSNVCTHEGCVADVECIAPNAPICFGGQCVECLGSAECGPGEQCVDHACIECLEDDQCPDGEVCALDYECIAPECFSGSECAEGELCVKHECQVPPLCNVQGDCPVGTGVVYVACLNGACVPNECNGDNDCGGETLYCLVQQDAPYVCVACPNFGYGSPGCAENEVCAGHHICEVPSCQDNDDCGGATPICANVVPLWSAGAPAACIQCVQDVQCQEGYICDQQTWSCVPSP